MLKTQITKEGQQEKVQYTKLEEFARNQNNDKIHRTQKAARVWSKLDSRIAALTTEIEALNGEIQVTQGDIDTTTGDKDVKTKECNKKWKAHSAENAQLLDDIESVKRAVSYVKSNLGQLEDAHPASPTALLAMLTRREESSAEARLRAVLTRQPNSAPHAYEHKSSSILQVLEDLLQEFKGRQRQKDVEANDAKQGCNLEIQNYGNQITANTNLNNEREEVVAKNTEARSMAEKEMADTAQELKDDVSFAWTLNGCNFIDEFTGIDSLPQGFFQEDYKVQCSSPVAGTAGVPGTADRNGGEFGQRKATYEQRKETRKQELGALTKAIALMEGDAGSKYSANKRLVGLVSEHVKQEVNVATHSNKRVLDLDSENDAKIEAPEDDGWIGIDDDDDGEDGNVNLVDDESDVSFLQVAMRHRAPKARKGQAPNNKRLCVQFLVKQATLLKSSVLSALVLQLHRADHFGKVRQLINDLITKLEEQLVAEGEQKQWCDTELTTTNEKRRSLETEIEKLSAMIDTDNAVVRDLGKGIKAEQEKHAELTEALRQRTDIEMNAKTVNEKTVEDAKAGLQAVQDAITLLEQFYSTPAFLQYKQPSNTTTGTQSQEWKAQGADAQGNTVADLMPENTFDKDYGGKQDESAGIIGLLKVIEADYKRTADTVAVELTESQKAFDTYKKDTSASIDDSVATKKTKEGEEDDAHARILDNQDTLAEKKTQLQTTMDYLEESLKPMCASAESGAQLEERRKRRKQEISALREALNILRNASFLSRH